MPVFQKVLLGELEDIWSKMWVATRMRYKDIFKHVANLLEQKCACSSRDRNHCSHIHHFPSWPSYCSCISSGTATDITPVQAGILYPPRKGWASKWQVLKAIVITCWVLWHCGECTAMDCSASDLTDLPNTSWKDRRSCIIGNGCSFSQIVKLFSSPACDSFFLQLSWTGKNETQEGFWVASALSQLISICRR